MRMSRGFACALIASAAAAFAQGAAPLPPNYKVIFENADVLVQQVHYGPHELVPMHDHPAASTVYVYLNDSGVVDITHEGPEGSTVHRPPTHTGAFRVSPGNFERHSVQNQSDLPSDFLRIELKHVPLKDMARVEAPAYPMKPGTKTEFSAPGLSIKRTICDGLELPCHLSSEGGPSLVVTLPTVAHPWAAGSDVVRWLAAGADVDPKLPGVDQPWAFLQIILPKL